MVKGCEAGEEGSMVKALAVLGKVMGHGFIQGISIIVLESE